MQRYFIYLSYDGAAYHGWQIQPNGVSVQECLMRALSTLLRSETDVVGAGRTDAGVHASLMVAHFDADSPLDTVLLADKLKSTLVINGDGRDLTLLREESIRNTDAFICLTGSSETNILTCLLAKKLGVKKTVAEVENIDYTGLAENLGIGTLINTKLIAASNIYRYTINVNVKHLKFVTFSEAEVFEVTVEEGAKITGGTLAELDFPDNANVGGIIRNGEAIIAKGDVRIEAGDDVVIFALPSAVKRVLKMFRK